MTDRTALPTFFWILRPAQSKADEEATLKLENGTCQIDDHMFDHDALVFDNQITKAGIALPDGTPYLEMRCVGFRTSASGPLPRTHPLYAWSHGWAAVMTVDLQGIFLKNHLSTI